MRLIRDAPLRWKILIPFALLSILYAALGSYVFSRAGTAERRAALDARLRDDAAVAADRLTAMQSDLTRSARSLSVTQGVSDAVGRRDVAALGRLVLPLALNRSRPLTFVTDAAGTALVEIRIEEGRAPVRSSGGDWSAVPVVRQAAAARPETFAEFRGAVVTRDGIAYLAVAAPVVGGRVATGAAVVADRLDGAVADLEELTGARVSLSDLDGRVLAGASLPAGPTAPRAGALRVHGVVGGHAADLLYVPFQILGEPAGMLAVALGSASGIGILGGRAWSIGLVVLLALGGMLVIGAWVARQVSRALGELLESTRRLRSGDLGHRARVRSRDEVGELSRSFNEMAENLEASHRDLENRVEERTQELRATLERLDRTNADLARASEAKSAFLSSMSHDLRTPLTAILISSEMLADPAFGSLSESRARELGSKILGGGRHLLSLIDELLDLSRVESGRMEVNPQPLHLAPLLTDVGDAVRAMAEEKGVTLDLPEVDGAIVRADPVRIRQVLLNLLVNAVGQTERGGLVRVEVAGGRRAVTVVVSDTGAGIARKDLRRIFEPLEHGPGRPSSWLGLAISKRVVEMHGGRLAVSSVPGAGSTFKLSLPTAGGFVTQAPASPKTEVALDRATSPARILLVEDDPAIIELAGNVLVAGGYRVDRTTSVAEAMARIESERPDLVLLDVGLGDADGLEVVRRLRAGGSDVLVVALSAFAVRREIDRAFDSGCDGYLVKPISARTLLSRVREFLDGERAPLAGVRS